MDGMSVGSAKADTNGENILMASEQSGIAGLKHTKTFVINVQEGFDKRCGYFLYCQH